MSGCPFTSAAAPVQLPGRLAFLRSVAERDGDVACFTIGGAPHAILNHPDHVRDVVMMQHQRFHQGIGMERVRTLVGDGLLTLEDDAHLQQRRLLQPAFHPEAIGEYARQMAVCARRRAALWRDGAVLDIWTEMSTLSLAVATRTLFDADIEDENASAFGAALEEALSLLNMAVLPLDRFNRDVVVESARFDRARATLDGSMFRMIAERRTAGGGRGDVLSRLVSARDPETGVGLSDQQIRDAAMTMILAGHETSASALCWTWYLLSQHPDKEAALHQELDDALARRPAEWQDVPALPYTRAVFAEALRLFPPVYLLGRRACAPYTVPGTDRELPAGSVLFLSQFLLHRDSRYWDAPEQFLPERWLPATADARATRHKFAYFPFGGGPRRCIGEAFAWAQGVLVLATLAQRWVLRLLPQRLEAEAAVTLQPAHGVRMACHGRGR